MKDRPKGVPNRHCVYQSRIDSDNDDPACER